MAKKLGCQAEPKCTRKIKTIDTAPWPKSEENLTKHFVVTRNTSFKEPPKGAKRLLEEEALRADEEGSPDGAKADAKAIKEKVQTKNGAEDKVKLKESNTEKKPENMDT